MGRCHSPYLTSLPAAVPDMSVASCRLLAPCAMTFPAPPNTPSMHYDHLWSGAQTSAQSLSCSSSTGSYNRCTQGRGHGFIQLMGDGRANVAHEGEEGYRWLRGAIQPMASNGKRMVLPFGTTTSRGVAKPHQFPLPTCQHDLLALGENHRAALRYLALRTAQPREEHVWL